MAIIAAKVTIRGTRPLLWHHFGPDALPLQKKAKTGVAGNDPTEWKKTVLQTRDGHLYLQPSYVFGCMRDGAKHTPRRRGTLQPVITATLQIQEDRILTDRRVPKKLEELMQAEDEPVYLDVRSVRNPGTRARNVRYRVAASPGWETSFTLLWDNTMIGEEEMQSVARDAGMYVGLGDGRSIGFGRFEVVEFKKIELGRQRNAKKKATKRSVAKNAG